LKYQKKPIPVDAVQFRKDARWPSSVFKHSWNAGPGNDEDLPTVSAGTVEHRYKTWISDGDWIVTYRSGLVEVCKDSVFRDLFESVVKDDDPTKTAPDVHILRGPGKAWCSISLEGFHLPYTTEANLSGVVENRSALICRKCSEEMAKG
jgi:hypothetical protein